MEPGKYSGSNISLVQSGICHCEGDPQVSNDSNELIKQYTQCK